MGELKKLLGFKSLLLIIINSIMGTGIFFLIAVSAKIAGISSIFSWLIMAIIAIYISTVFAELCSMFPTSGGVYDFTKNIFGKATSFIIGWITFLISNITIAMLTVGAIQYLLTANVKTIIIPISILFLLIFYGFAYFGMKTSKVMLIAFSIITLSTIISLIIGGFLHFNPASFSGIVFDNKFLIVLAIFFIAETFFGWESAALLSAEVEDGKHVVPKAMVIGTVIICFISLLFVISTYGSVNIVEYANSDAPLSFLATSYFGVNVGVLFTLLVYLSIIGSVADWAVSSPRLVLSLARDKLFLPQFAEIHPKYFTPHKAIIFQAIVSILIVIVGAGSYHTLLELLVPLLFFMYSFVMLTLIVLRLKKPELERPYTAPFGLIGPLLVIIFFIILGIIWFNNSPNALHTIKFAISLIIFGYPIYFLIEMYHDPKMIVGVNDFFAYVTLFTEKIFLPVSIRNEILSLLGNIHNRIVLEFGCSVGSLTLHLAEAVGPKGKIYATDLAERGLVIVRRRLERNHHKHVEVLHDPFLHSRVHDHIPKVNCVVSVGMIGYLQDVERVLSGLNKRLEVGDRIVIVDYDNYFYLIPNIPWLASDSKIKNVFEKCGFNVGVIRKQGMLWQYIYIYGVKSIDV